MSQPKPTPAPVPVLILLNGPPGCGKSTLATRYAADHPLALALDVDRLRSMLGRWQDTPGEAGLAARAIALAAARTHLQAGHDVVVPQLVAQLGFLEQLDALVAGLAVPFAELVLLDTKEGVRARFAARTARAERTEHVEAAVMLDRAGGTAELDRFHDRLLALLPTRPRAVRITSSDGAVEETYAAVLAAVEAARRAATPANATAADTAAADPGAAPDPGGPTRPDTDPSHDPDASLSSDTAAG